MGKSHKSGFFPHIITLILNPLIHPGEYVKLYLHHFNDNSSEVKIQIVLLL